MTVANTTVRQLYTADGIQTTFAIPFAFISGDAESETKVYTVDAEGVKTLKSINTDYTLDPSGDDPTNVIFVLAPDDDVLVTRLLPLTQIIDYINTGKFKAESHELGMDRVVLMIQQLAEQLGDTLQINVRDDGSLDLELPPVVADSVLAVNEAGDGFEWKSIDEFLQGETGPQGPAGADGTNGVDGNDGADGTNGLDGTQITIANGAPSNGSGNDGDFYIEEDNDFELYHKESGVWVDKGSLKGADGSAGTMQSQTFDTDGTWVVPAGVTEIWAELIGGGGGGGGGGNGTAASGAASGGGGGGGGQKSLVLCTVTPADTLTIEVGDAGSAGAVGTAGGAGGESYIQDGGAVKLARVPGGTAGAGGTTAGGTTSGGSGGLTDGHILTVGGTGGAAGTGGSAGAAGSAGGRNLYAIASVGGDPGTSGGGNSGGGGGGGGAGYAPGGAGGRGGNHTIVGAPTDGATGSAGTGKGAGGGGGGGGGGTAGANTSGGTGGAGVKGRVVIYWTA